MTTTTHTVTITDPSGPYAPRYVVTCTCGLREVADRCYQAVAIKAHHRREVYVAAKGVTA